MIFILNTSRYQNARTALLMLILGLILQLIGAVCAHALTLSDDRGVASTFRQAPQRVVTLLPSLTETVCALGACGRLVGTDRYSSYPSSVQALPKLGGLDDLNIERMVALRPDVVLMSASSPRVADRLAALGVAVMVLEAQDLAGVRHVLKQVSRLLQVGDAEQVWQTMASEAQTIAAQVPAKTQGWRVYYEIDSSPYAAGATSFIGQNLSRLGLRNIVGPQLGPFPKLNPEFVVRADPQLILVAEHDVQSLRQRPGWQHIAAVRQQHICGLSAPEIDAINRPGPRLAEGLRALLRCLSRLSAGSAVKAGV
jgi:iron complex transport system substrate-binding protein